MAAAAPSATPAQSKTPRPPARRGEAQDRLLGDLAPELGPRVPGPVVVVLHGDGRQHVGHGLLVDAVLLGVGRGDHGEHRGRGERPRRAVARRVHGVQALEPAVLDLLRPDRHGHVVGAGRHRVDGAAQGLGAGGAVVLDPGDGLVLQLEGAGQRDAAHAALRRAEPVGVDVVLVDPGRGEGLGAGIDDQVVEALLPQLGELGAAHPDDGHLVADAVRSHQDPPPARTGRAFQK